MIKENETFFYFCFMYFRLKTIIVITSFFLCPKSFCQDLIVYRDTINLFSIGIPKAWQYQTSKTTEPGLKLFVVRPKNDEAEKFTENYNVNIVPFPNSNIESAYFDLKATISQRKGYTFISEGDTTIGGVKYKWHLEKHINTQTAQPMIALIVLGYRENNGYMVTLGTTEEMYPKYETLYRKIAASFRL